MPPPADETADENEFGDNVDMATFEQILDMDDEEEPDREFSRGIVFGFIEQAEQTFDKMDQALAEKDLNELSSLGHFLKGSSATLGFTKIKDECERIQHYGHKKDETGTIDEPDKEKCLALIARAVAEAKEAYAVVSVLMRKYYNET